MAKGQIKQAQERIDKRQFETLCGMQCTEEEICSVFEVSKDTLLRWCKNTYEMDFADVFKEKRAYGTASLRRTQWRMAEDNVAMAIWLALIINLGVTARQYYAKRVCPNGAHHCKKGK